MRYFIYGFLSVLIMLVSCDANPYLDPDEDLSYPGNYVDDILQQQQQQQTNQQNDGLNAAEKRACVRRGGNCDHHPNDCCYSSSCRCNLWGSNCRCQRMGLFQKWG